jgi:hypothetical protein
MTTKCTWCQKKLPERDSVKEGLKESICLECLEEMLTMAGAMARKDARSEKKRKPVRQLAPTHHI